VVKSPVDHIKYLHLEQSVAELDFTKKILQRCSHLPVTIIADRSVPEITLEEYPASLHEGKRHLLLCQNRGAFLKSCPATREYRCCDYQVINIGMNCPMDCVYCILQAYLNNPWLSFFMNVDDVLVELDEAFSDNSTDFRRIGTGEFTDSMALDSITGLSQILVEYMSRQTSGVLELKTKTAEIANLEGLAHNDKTIVAWSLNSRSIMLTEELRVASLEERVDAALQCAQWGYRLAFHFDPIVWHTDWQQGYGETIEYLFARIPKDRIAWISMGGLRYLPKLKAIAAQRFPNSKIFFEEFVLGLDGKQRYFRDHRTEMYTFVGHEIMRHKAPETCLYLCMESDEIWQEVFGYRPEEKGGLPGMLDNAVRQTA